MKTEYYFICCYTEKTIKEQPIRYLTMIKINIYIYNNEWVQRLRRQRLFITFKPRLH